MLDVRVHPAGLTDPDLETLVFFGVTEVVLVADATAHPATPGALLEHFHHLVDREVPRFEQAGLRARAALGVHPRVVPRRGLLEVLDALPRFVRKGKVAAVGLLGLRAGDEAEMEALTEQLALARRLSLPAFVSTPAEQREAVTRKLLTVLRQSRLPPERILVDGAVGRTVRAIRELGYWVGLTVHPEHLSAERAVALVRTLGPRRLVLSSAAGDAGSELLALPRTVHLLGKAGLSSGVVRRVSRLNARTLLGS